MRSRGNPEHGWIAVSLSRTELSEVVSSVRPEAHKGVEGNRFGGNTGENVKRVSGNGIGEVRDNSNAVPSIRSLV
jgi:hypothetical protein